MAGIQVTPITSTKGQTGDLFGELTTKIHDSLDTLKRIEVLRLQVGRGKGYQIIAASDEFKGVVDEIDGSPVGAEAIARTVLEYAANDAAEFGTARYRFRGVVRAKGPGGEKEAWICHGQFSNDGDEEETPTIDAVKMFGSVRGMMSDMHARYLGSLDKTLALADSVMRMANETADASAKNNATLIEALRMKLEFEEKQGEREAEYEAGKQNREILRDVVKEMGRPFAERFSSAFGDILEKRFGVARDGTFAARLGKIFASLDADELKKFEEIVGSDIWEVLQSCCKAKDDDTFRAVFQRAVVIWQRDDERANAQMMRLAQALGAKSAGFVMLLRDIGAGDS